MFTSLAVFLWLILSRCLSFSLTACLSLSLPVFLWLILSHCLSFSSHCLSLYIGRMGILRAWHLLSSLLLLFRDRTLQQQSRSSDSHNNSSCHNNGSCHVTAPAPIRQATHCAQALYAKCTSCHTNLIKSNAAESVPTDTLNYIPLSLLYLIRVIRSCPISQLFNFSQSVCLT